jgi:hypothetical protein
MTIADEPGIGSIIKLVAKSGVYSVAGREPADYRINIASPYE